ncbi:HEAT repeat domain-containing protein [Proteiniborus sp. MB09-C3]|uniref:HEAT repeat domain-containing protein n=1 Tax=Proteiniborus sp. MB09-C3 TaxID=3050072 RepID=UPI002556DF79|nr:HEAT repeat domain-containing protein [Proteiniborus sp. MB09-C3]WIV11062.1 HEAT repeat domain-containing protein [Proteiniborus sp. MB09-C3]
MKTVLDKLKNELNSFWLWANQTSHEYAKNVWKLEQEEWEYPNWDRLIELTIEAIKAVRNGGKSKELIDCILEVMALDNEDEQILDECQDNLTYDALSYLVHIATLHIQSEARWQIAKLLGRYKDQATTGFLNSFIDDESKYVQRKALLSLVKVSPSEVKRYV